WSMDWSTVFVAFWCWSLAGLSGGHGANYRTPASCNAHTLVLCPAESPPQPPENCLPTQNLRTWPLARISSQTAMEVRRQRRRRLAPPRVDDKDLRPAGVLPIGISVTRGGHPIGVPQAWTKYLYAWGRVTYVDGFGEERWTNFCHRYNTETEN